MVYEAGNRHKETVINKLVVLFKLLHMRIRTVVENEESVDMMVPAHFQSLQ